MLAVNKIPTKIYRLNITILAQFLIRDIQLYDYNENNMWGNYRIK